MIKHRPFFRQNKWYLLFVFVFVIFVYGSGMYFMLTSTGLPSPMATLASEQFHFSIDYPKNWAASDLPGGNHGDHEVIAFIGFTGPAQPHVFISRKSFEQPTLEDIANWGESRIVIMCSKGCSISMGPLSSPNNSALLRQYSLTSQGFFGIATDSCIDWYTITDSTGYDLQFCVHEKYWPKMESIFLQMAQSFEAK